MPGSAGHWLSGAVLLTWCRCRAGCLAARPRDAGATVSVEAGCGRSWVQRPVAGVCQQLLLQQQGHALAAMHWARQPLA